MSILWYRIRDPKYLCEYQSLFTGGNELMSVELQYSKGRLTSLQSPAELQVLSRDLTELEKAINDIENNTGVVTQTITNNINASLLNFLYLPGREGGQVAHGGLGSHSSNYLRLKHTAYAVGGYIPASIFIGEGEGISAADASQLQVVRDRVIVGYPVNQTGRGPVEFAVLDERGSIAGDVFSVIPRTGGDCEVDIGGNVTLFGRVGVTSFLIEHEGGMTTEPFLRWNGSPEGGGLTVDRGNIDALGYIHAPRLALKGITSGFEVTVIPLATTAAYNLTLPGSITANGFLKTAADGTTSWVLLASGDLAAHTHDAGDVITGVFVINRIPDLSSLYSVVSHDHDSDYSPIGHGHPWTDISATPTTIGGYGITNAQLASTILTSLAGLGAATGVVNKFSATEFNLYQIGVAQPWELLDRQSGDARYAAIVHDHIAADITSGVLALGRIPDLSSFYSVVGHDHDSDYSPVGHTHATADITSGTFADARIAASNVTQHQAALVIATSQLTGSVAITGGGTGQISALAAFNALSPVTTRGDLITRDVTNNVRLAHPTVANRVLRSTSTDPTWAQGDIDMGNAFALTIGTLRGGIASAGNLVLSSTSHATKGHILFGANARFIESNPYWSGNPTLGIGFSHEGYYGQIEVWDPAEVYGSIACKAGAVLGFIAAVPGYPIVRFGSGSNHACAFVTNNVERIMITAAGDTVVGDVSGQLPLATLHIKTTAIGTPSLRVSAITGQTADLSQWMNSAGAKVTAVDAGGNLFTPGALGMFTVAPASDLSRQIISDTPGAPIVIASGGATIGATNKGAGAHIISTGIGTGDSTPAQIRFRAPAQGTASGTTDQDLRNRGILNVTEWLANAQLKTLVTITLAAGQMASGQIGYSIEASNGTDMIALRGQLLFQVVNKAGTYTGTSYKVEATPALSDGTDTISTTWSYTHGTNETLLQLTCTVGGMTPTTFRITYDVWSGSQQNINAPAIGVGGGGAGSGGGDGGTPYEI